MYIRANADGTFFNGPTFTNQALFCSKTEIHSGIESFVMQMSKHSRHEFPNSPSPELVVELFGLPMTGQVEIAAESKNTFYIDELYGVVNEKKIWN